jgi:4,5-DOPA dioxygenase extradiol
MAEFMTPVFVSHGSPDLAITQTAAHDFLKSYGRSVDRPKAILTVSAHFETSGPVLVTDPSPEMIYDFGGFDPALREIVYPAPGAPEVARLAFEALEAAGLEPKLTEKRGYDHGVWVPLMLLFAKADIPVAQLSIDPHRDPAWHYRLGQALQPLTEHGVLVLGSGSLTHNLHEVFTPAGLRRRDDEVPQWVDDFAAWIAGRLAEGDVESLLNYRERAPFAVENHPTDEHLLPLFVALGAAGEHALGRRLHDSREFGVLAMDAYAFDAEQAA